jgi:serine/threonine protein phosphatase 1
MKKTVAFSDIHGNYKLWEAIKNYYDKDDTIIFLGDATDRGPDGIKIMQEMFADDRVSYILGNHEQLFLEYINEGQDEPLTLGRQALLLNGGTETIKQYMELPQQEQEELIDNLKNNTFYNIIYINKEKKNIFLSHAGCDISSLFAVDNHSLMWDRTHLGNTAPWEPQFKYWYIVHGHTPVQNLNIGKVVLEIDKTCGGHKIDIDLGTIVSKTIAVLDLDTLKPTYFKEEDGGIKIW